jgi:hypothetical protein
VAALAATLAITSAAPALADELGTMAERLSALRAEVESISDQLSAHKNDVQEQIRSYARLRSELELEVQREQTRAQKLRQAMAQKQAESEALSNADKSAGPSFEQNLNVVRRYVAQSLPFRQKERLAELDKIEEQHKSGLLAPQRALNRLWSFVEDELRMTRESGLFSQPVVVEGKEQLAEVIRIGMVALYYRTPDGSFGSSVKQGDAWAFRSIDDQEDQKRVRTLFETFKKQIRVGYFNLPNALPTATQTGAR